MKNAIIWVRASSSGRANQTAELAGDPAMPPRCGDCDPENPERPEGEGGGGRRYVQQRSRTLNSDSGNPVIREALRKVMMGHAGAAVGLAAGHKHGRRRTGPGLKGGGPKVH